MSELVPIVVYINIMMNAHGEHLFTLLTLILVDQNLNFSSYCQQAQK